MLDAVLDAVCRCPSQLARMVVVARPPRGDGRACRGVLSLCNRCTLRRREVPRVSPCGNSGHNRGLGLRDHVPRGDLPLEHGLIQPLLEAHLAQREMSMHGCPLALVHASAAPLQKCPEPAAMNLATRSRPTMGVTDDGEADHEMPWGAATRPVTAQATKSANIQSSTAWRDSRVPARSRC